MSTVCPTTTLNLGVVAHVDAGKTSLTERLLHAAGVIDVLGRVDDGSTRTDTLALERSRGITIRSAVVSFPVDGTVVNLIDTPGHPDFIAEVERVLGVLDGAVLVVSAVEGVQAQTRVLLHSLRRLGIPTLIFVNKIDRRGARPAAVLAELVDGLEIDAYPMGDVLHAGTPAAGFRRDSPPADDELVRSQTAAGEVHPVFFGSAITGAGVPELIAGLTTLLPVAVPAADGPTAGTVFKIDRGAAGVKLAYVALRSGTLRTRGRLPAADGRPDGDKITRIEVFDHGTVRESDELPAGRIGRLHGLRHARIGDPIGTMITADPHVFGPPTLETVVVPDRPQDTGRLSVALQQLVEQDPLIAGRQHDRPSGDHAPGDHEPGDHAPGDHQPGDHRRGDGRDVLRVALYGEVQKEVLAATLAADFGVAVSFRATTPACVERLLGRGAAAELIATEPNPFLATVGLRVEPGPVGSGIDYGLEVELGSMPPAFIRAVEETVREALGQGVHGWPVPDAVVRLTHSGYYPRQSHAHGTFDKSMSSTAGDFRHLTQLVLAAAVTRARTQVCHPVQRFRLELPADAWPAVLPVLALLGAVPFAPTPVGRRYVLAGDVPAARVHELTQRLPGLTRGEGMLTTAFDHYAPVTGPVPTRPRNDDNPYDRDAFLRTISRRVAVRRR
jgi:ribosomal protection tetracycline resistance protein